VIDVGSTSETSVSRRAVLFRTDWSRHWGSDAYFSGHPHLTTDVASWLVTEGVTLVGIDSLNIDGTHTGERPVHSMLLAAGVPIVSISVASTDSHRKASSPHHRAWLDWGRSQCGPTRSSMGIRRCEEALDEV
jgi:hypothetical protein